MRVMFSGYNPLGYKLFVWTFSAVLCGIAGALYVPQVGIINPGEMSPANSIEMAVWVAVGGRGTLIGPIVGAFLVNGAKTMFTAYFAEYWLFLLGAMFVLVTLYLPRWRGGPVAPPAQQRTAAQKIQAATGEAVNPAAVTTATGSEGMNAATSQPGAQHGAQRGADQAESGDATGLGRVLEPGVIDTSHGPILYLEDLTMQFDGFRALNKLSLSIDHGELRCVIGPNGAGKTTMMDVITGKTGPRNANVSGCVFLGQSIDLMRMSEPRIAQVGISRKFKPTVFEQHEVWGEPGTGDEGGQALVVVAARAADRRGPSPHRGNAGADRARRRGVSPGRPAVPRPEAAAGDRHVADAAAATAAAR